MSLRSEVTRIVNELLGNGKKISQLPAGSSPDGTELIEAVQNGVNVKLTVSQVSSGPSEHFKGAWDASVNLYPNVGTILAGDEWYVSVEGDLNINGLGVTTVYPGTLLKSLVNTPGQTPANWKVTQ